MPSLLRASTSFLHCVDFPDRSHPSKTIKAPLEIRRDILLRVSLNLDYPCRGATVSSFPFGFHFRFVLEIFRDKYSSATWKELFRLLVGADAIHINNIDNNRIHKKYKILH